MFMEITVYNDRGAIQGRVQLELRFGKPANRWVLQEVLDGDGWNHITFSNPSQGTFEVKDNGVIWLLDQEPGKPAQHNTLIIYDAPKDDSDYKKTEGQARIYDPSDSTFKNGWIRWRTPGLTAVRQRVLEVIGKTFPPYPGKLPIPNPIDRSDSYSGGVTNCGVLPGWVARQLGYYLPWEEKTKRVREEAIKKGLWEETKKKLKLEDREFLYQIPQNEMIEVEKQKTSFVAPMAAGWGMGRLEEYPLLLEKVRKLEPGTIWINYFADKSKYQNRRPLPGDIYVLQDAAGHFAHVGIIIDATGREWRTADCGQFGVNAAAYKKRLFNEQAGTLVLDPPETNIPDAGMRWLQGWVNIDNLFSGWHP